MDMQGLESSYVEKRANKCLFCDSRDVTFGNFHCGMLGDGWQSMKCNDCGSTWERLFELFAIANEIYKGNEKGD